MMQKNSDQSYKIYPLVSSKESNVIACFFLLKEQELKCSEMKDVWGRISPNLTVCVQFSLMVGFSVWFFHVDLMCVNEKRFGKHSVWIVW